MDNIGYDMRNNTLLFKCDISNSQFSTTKRQSNWNIYKFRNMKRKLEPWFSTIPTKYTKRTITISPQLTEHTNIVLLENKIKMTNVIS